MKKKILTLIACTCMYCLCACSSILPDTSSNGDYATQTPPSAIEYSIYMNKQITVFTSQLTTHMALIVNAGSNYENIIVVAEESAKIMEDVLDEVIVTYPAVTYEDDRDATIIVMETTIEHMKSYIEDLKDGKSISEYVDNFQNDYYALTGQANLYYQ